LRDWTIFRIVITLVRKNNEEPLGSLNCVHASEGSKGF
jgi:hypothetical protein